MRRIIIFVLILLACSCTPKVVNHGIVNLWQVDAHVWRSGQPMTLADWQYLQSSVGIKRVIKLNYDSEGSDDLARSLGMIVYELSVQPVGLGDILKRPDPDKLAEAIRLLEHADGVLVHCKNGWDRTGLLVGMYRVIYDGWTTDRAYEEMRRLGFHPELRGLHEAWEAFAAAHNAGATQ
jgi:hypothetical protein